MMIFNNLFGQKEKIDKKDYFDYDNISKETRQKVSYVIQVNFLTNDPVLSQVGNLLNLLRYEIKKCKGIISINDEDPVEISINSWLRDCSVIDFLRTIEISLSILNGDLGHIKKYLPDCQERLKETAQEINDIFDIAKIGYQIVENRIVRRDSEYLHRETTKKAVSLLKNNSFEGPLEEFEKALSKYSQGDYSGAIYEANKAYESTMKSILTELNISFEEKYAAARLVGLLYENQLLSPIMQSFNSNLNETLKSLLKTLPTLRNNMGGHGQGKDPKNVSKSYAEFALHICGSFIVFLIHRYEEHVNKSPAEK